MSERASVADWGRSLRLADHDISDNAGAPLVDTVDRRQPRQAVLHDGRRMLTLRQVAERMQVDVRTVRKLIRLGELKAKRLSVRVTRVPESVLAEYMEQ